MDVLFQNVTKSYGNHDVVQDICLTVEPGAFHFLLGPSGCGKTTILRMLAGLEKVTSGQIILKGKDITHTPPGQRGIAMVFQQYALWPHMTVEENIRYVLRLKKFPREKISTKVKHVLEMTRLCGYNARYPSQLSGGQQQRVALARALAVEPGLLLLDEPLSNLDAQLRSEMRQHLSQIHEETGITTLYVTHDQKEALALGSAITIMDKGKCVQTASPRELYGKPSSQFVATFLGDTNLIPVEKVSSQGMHTCLGILPLGQKHEGFYSLRPEHIRLWSESPQLETKNHIEFQAKILSISYGGEAEQITLLPFEGPPLKAIYFIPQGGASLEKNQTVWATVALEDFWLLPTEKEGEKS